MGNRVRPKKAMAMSKPLVITLLIGLLFILSGCGSAAPSPGPAAGTPTAAPGATAPPPSPVPGPPGSPLTAGCTLLDSHDVASLFSSAEVEGPIRQVGEVSHPIFSTATISATESLCTYQVFHKPGSNARRPEACPSHRRFGARRSQDRSLLHRIPREV
jgi:hypothetical protein